MNLYKVHRIVVVVFIIVLLSFSSSVHIQYLLLHHVTYKYMARRISRESIHLRIESGGEDGINPSCSGEEERSSCCEA